MKTSSTIEREVMEEIRGLPAQEQKKILDVVRIFKRDVIKVTPKRHDITELKGCGKKIWKETDAQKYVNKLRGEWK